MKKLKKKPDRHAYSASFSRGLKFLPSGLALGPSMALNLWTKNAFLVTSTSKMLARAAHFGPLKISDHLSRKLAQKDIINPTEIQEKV